MPFGFTLDGFIAMIIAMITLFVLYRLSRRTSELIMDIAIPGTSVDQRKNNIIEQHFIMT